MDIEQKVLGIIGSKRVKGTIIKVLSEQGSLNLNEIYKIIVRSYFLNVTRQAVHKMLKNLQDQNVLIQQEKKYSINLSWVEELEQFSKKLKNGILLHSPIYLEGLSDFKEFSGEKIFTFDSLNAAEEYRKKLQKEYLTQVGKKPVYVGYSKHIKSPLVYSEKSISILNLIKKNNSECIILVSGNSKTDEWCAQYYRNEFIRVKIGCDLTNNCEMMVLGDVITQLFIPIELQKKFDELYLKTDQIGKINIPKLFDQIYSSNEEIKFIVYKNNELANQLRK